MFAWLLAACRGVDSSGWLGTLARALFLKGVLPELVSLAVKARPTPWIAAVAAAASTPLVAMVYAAAIPATAKLSAVMAWPPAMMLPEAMASADINTATMFSRVVAVAPYPVA